MTIESMFGFIFIGFGSVIAYAFLKWIVGLINAKRAEKILEINLALKTIDDSNADKSVDDLVVSANADKSGGPGDPPKDGK